MISDMRIQRQLRPWVKNIFGWKERCTKLHETLRNTFFSPILVGRYCICDDNETMTTVAAKWLMTHERTGMDGMKTFGRTSVTDLRAVYTISHLKSKSSWSHILFSWWGSQSVETCRHPIELDHSCCPLGEVNEVPICYNEKEGHGSLRLRQERLSSVVWSFHQCCVKCSYIQSNVQKVKNLQFWSSAVQISVLHIQLHVRKFGVRKSNSDLKLTSNVFKNASRSFWSCDSSLHTGHRTYCQVFAACSRWSFVGHSKKHALRCHSLFVDDIISVNKYA